MPDGGYNFPSRNYRSANRTVRSVGQPVVVARCGIPFIDNGRMLGKPSDFKSSLSGFSALARIIVSCSLSASCLGSKIFFFFNRPIKGMYMRLARLLAFALGSRQTFLFRSRQTFIFTFAFVIAIFFNVGFRSAFGIVYGFRFIVIKTFA